jgi:DNA ligase-1
MELQTLYSLNAHNKIIAWTVSTFEHDGIGHVKRRWGVEDGKFQEACTEIKSGKNIGKKNETTIMQQAEIKARSFYNKRIDEGNTPDKNKVNIAVVRPMLAHKWKDDDKRMPKLVMVQPKLDGVRALVGMKCGKAHIMSRLGKPIKSMPHICEAVENLNLPNNTYLDGELYSADVKFEDISGACRRHAPDSQSAKIQYHVFDCFNMAVTGTTFDARYDTLEAMDVKEPIRLVETLTVKKRLVESYLDEFIARGYEGVMIRDPASPYMLNERSTFLLKYKRFYDKEYKIIGANQASGRDKGTVVWLCETAEGVEFACRPQGTIEYRREMWETHHEHIGKMLTVRFQELTRDGVPRFPVGVDIRDYE